MYDEDRIKTDMEGHIVQKIADEICNDFEERIREHEDELKWLYMEMYDDHLKYTELRQKLKEYYAQRKQELKIRDREKQNDKNWFKKSGNLGMMLYVDNFSDNLKCMEKKLAYLRKCNVNYVHLMPLLKTTRGRSDGGYAVADFRVVEERLGTMSDLELLTEKCHEQNINICLDFVMNHTSEDHIWAKRARQGEGEYQDRYFFYDSYEIPARYEETVPQVFPKTAPGNFTWLEDAKKYVMTTFYPYQWDLNYANPVVFEEMMCNFLFLANRGIDIFRIDAVPYIWKEIGTSCRNLPKVHTIVRMMRMISEIVCPGVLLLGEVVMEPEKVVPYFGTVEKPECHMLYNVTTMATIWNSVATRDVRLLKKQMDILSELPGEYVFLNYLRCHDDIGWGLEYNTLRSWCMEEVPHKKYLNDFFTGKYPGSFSRGELYNEDPETGDARFCGTTASMCGIERGIEEGDEELTKRGIQLDLMLHAYMFTLSGIPILYSGDEVGQMNDYQYKNDPEKKDDSRYIHRGRFLWNLADSIREESTIPGAIFTGLDRLAKIRKKEKVFNAEAAFWTIETGEQSVLCCAREIDGEKMVGCFNFSNQEKQFELKEGGEFCDLISGQHESAGCIRLTPFGFRWLKEV